LGDSYTNIGHQIQIFKSIQKQEKETIKELQEHWEQLVRRNKEFELVLDKQRHKDRLLAEQAWAFVHVGEKVRISRTIKCSCITHTAHRNSWRLETAVKRPTRNSSKDKSVWRPRRWVSTYQKLSWQF
jgi:hypothetical protein